MACVVTASGSSGDHDKKKKKVDEMVDILIFLQQYVPMRQITTYCCSSLNTTHCRIENGDYTQILLGGDQLTAERMRGAHNKFRTSRKTLTAILIPFIQLS